MHIRIILKVNSFLLRPNIEMHSTMLIKMIIERINVGTIKTQENMIYMLTSTIVQREIKVAGFRTGDR